MSLTNIDNPSSLWSFTLERYSEPGVQGAAIGLQEKQGADVNFLFYCAWHAVTGRGRLDAANFEKAEAQVACWREEVTLPLRRLRNHIKAEPGLAGLEGAMDVRGKILGAEVESERIAQIVIEATAGPPEEDAAPVTPHEIAEENLRAYLAYINADVDEAAETDLQTLLRGVIPS